MEDEEAKLKLEYLITKYIEDNEQKRELIDEVKRRGPSISKGILAEIQSSKKVPYEDQDREIVHEIVFNYV